MFSSQRILRVMFLGLVLLMGTNAHADWGWTGDTYKLVRPCNIDTGFVSYRDSQEPKGRYCTEGSCFAYHTNFASGGKTYDYYGCEIVEQEPDPTPPPFSCPTGNSGTTVSSKKLRSVCMVYNGGHCAAQVTNSSLDSGLYDLSYTFTGVVCDPSAPADIDPTPDPQPAPDPTPDPEPDPDPEPTPVVCQPPRYEINGQCISPSYPSTREGFTVNDYPGNPASVYKILTAVSLDNLNGDGFEPENHLFGRSAQPKRVLFPDDSPDVVYAKVPSSAVYYPSFDFNSELRGAELMQIAAQHLSSFDAKERFEYEDSRCSQNGGAISFNQSSNEVNGWIRYKCNYYSTSKKVSGTYNISHNVFNMKTEHVGYRNGGDPNPDDGSDGDDSSGDGPCDPTKQVCPIDIRNQTNKLVEGLEAQTNSLQGAIQAVGTGISGVSDDINSLDGSIQSLGIKLDTIANNTNPGESQPLDDLLENPSGVFSDATAFREARTQEQADLDSQYSQLSNEYTDSATSIEDKADTLFTSIKNRVINTYPEADCEGLAYAFDTNHEPLRITCEDTSFFRVGMLFFLSGYLLLDAYHLFRSKKDTV